MAVFKTDSGVEVITKEDVSEENHALKNESQDENNQGILKTVSEIESSNMVEGSLVEGGVQDDSSTLLHFKESEETGSRLHTVPRFQTSTLTTDSMLDKSALLVQRSSTPNQPCHQHETDAPNLQEDASGDHSHSSNIAEEEFVPQSGISFADSCGSQVHETEISIEDSGKEETEKVIEILPSVSIHPLSKNKENVNGGVLETHREMELLEQKKEVDGSQVDNLKKDQISRMVDPVDPWARTQVGSGDWSWFGQPKEEVKSEDEKDEEFELCKMHGHPKSLFCIACESSICHQCISTHFGHDVKEKVDISNLIVEKLNVIFKSVKSSQSFLKLHSRTAVKQHFLNFKQSTDDCLRKYREFKNELMTHLNQEEARLEDEIADMHRSKVQIWKQNLESMANVQKDLKVMVTKANLHRNPRIPENFQQLLNSLNRGQQILDELPSLYCQVLSHEVDNESVDIVIDPISNKWKFVKTRKEVFNAELDESLSDCAAVLKTVVFKATEGYKDKNQHGAGNVRYQNISNMTEFENWSFEEIRWSCYASKKIVSTSKQTIPMLDKLLDFKTLFVVPASSQPTASRYSLSIFENSSKSLSKTSSSIKPSVWGSGTSSSKQALGFTKSANGRRGKQANGRIERFQFGGFSFTQKVDDESGQKTNPPTRGISFTKNVQDEGSDVKKNLAFGEFGFGKEVTDAIGDLKTNPAIGRLSFDEKLQNGSGNQKTKPTFGGSGIDKKINPWIAAYERYKLSRTIAGFKPPITTLSLANKVEDTISKKEENTIISGFKTEEDGGRDEKKGFRFGKVTEDVSCDQKTKPAIGRFSFVKKVEDGSGNQKNKTTFGGFGFARETNRWIDTINKQKSSTAIGGFKYEDRFGNQKTKPTIKSTLSFAKKVEDRFCKEKANTAIGSFKAKDRCIDQKAGECIIQRVEDGSVGQKTNPPAISFGMKVDDGDRDKKNPIIGGFSFGKEVFDVSGDQKTNPPITGTSFGKKVEDGGSDEKSSLPIGVFSLRKEVKGASGDLKNKPAIGMLGFAKKIETTSVKQASTAIGGFTLKDGCVDQKTKPTNTTLSFAKVEDKISEKEADTAIGGFKVKDGGVDQKAGKCFVQKEKDVSGGQKPNIPITGINFVKKIEDGASDEKSNLTIGFGFGKEVKAASGDLKTNLAGGRFSFEKKLEDRSGDQITNPTIRGFSFGKEVEDGSGDQKPNDKIITAFEGFSCCQKESGNQNTKPIFEGFRFTQMVGDQKTKPTFEQFVASSKQDLNTKIESFKEKEIYVDQKAILTVGECFAQKVKDVSDDQKTKSTIDGISFSKMEAANSKKEWDSES